MRSKTIGLFVIGTLAAGSGAFSQTAPAPTVTPPAITSPTVAPAVPSVMPRAASPAATAPHATTTTAATIVEASTLEAGANSFTESQAKGRFEDAGFTSVQGLTKDDAGFWRARATRNGMPTDVAMDFHGRIAAGSGVTALRAGAARATPPTGTTTPVR